MKIEHFVKVTRVLFLLREMTLWLLGVEHAGVVSQVTLLFFI
jgi:hypothetical protein